MVSHRHSCLDSVFETDEESHGEGWKVNDVPAMKSELIQGHRKVFETGGAKAIDRNFYTSDKNFSIEIFIQVISQQK